MTEKAKRDTMKGLVEEINTRLGPFGYRAQISEMSFTARRKTPGKRYFNWEGKTRHAKGIEVDRLTADGWPKNVFRYNPLSSLQRLGYVRRWLEEKVYRHEHGDE